MLTHPGANYEMHRVHQRKLRRAGHIHRFGALCPRHLLSRREHAEAGPASLGRAKQINPDLRISFDPGFDWAEHPSEDVEGILALTDLLFLNYREFKAWTLLAWRAGRGRRPEDPATLHR